LCFHNHPVEVWKKIAGDTVTLAIVPAQEWPEPEVPEDLQNALAADP